MRWLGLTLALLTATAALMIGIYVRDRDPNAWHPPTPQLARGDAEGVLAGIQGWHCHAGCAVESVSPVAGGRWFTRLEVRFHPVCAEIDLNRFSIDTRSSTGFTGVVFGCALHRSNAAHPG